MGVPAVAACHFRTSLVLRTAIPPVSLAGGIVLGCPVRAGCRGRGYPGMHKLLL